MVSLSFGGSKLHEVKEREALSKLMGGLGLKEGIAKFRGETTPRFTVYIAVTMCVDILFLHIMLINSSQNVSLPF